MRTLLPNTPVNHLHTGAGMVGLHRPLDPPADRLQVHVLRLGQNLEKRGLAVKRVYSSVAHDAHSDPGPPVAQSRPARQQVRPGRQGLQRTPGQRGRVFIQPEDLLDPEPGAPVGGSGQKLKSMSSFQICKYSFCKLAMFPKHSH